MTNIDTLKLKLKQELTKIYGKRLAKIILYGSYSRGNYHEDSDIDFLVVLCDNEILIGKELAYMNKVVFELTLQYNIAISHYPTTLQKFENSQAMFYQQIRKEGKIIYERRNRENITQS
jgi:predicted nucleotidyltransferase